MTESPIRKSRTFFISQHIMDFSNVKLIITDLDGTLLNSQHELSADFLTLFKQLKGHNVMFVAASGRPYYSMISKFDAIKDELIIVSENGGLAIKNEEVFLSTPLTDTNFVEICNLVSNLEETHAVFCAKEQAYVLSDSIKLYKLLNEYYPKHTIISNVSEISSPIYKVALFHEDSSERYIYPHVKALENRFKVKVSANHWVDISEHLANKGHALARIQERYGISPEDTVAFGDYNNDIEMLELAKYSFAMKNAHPNVKAIANFETKSNDKQGVEHILKQIIEAKTRG